MSRSEGASFRKKSHGLSVTRERALGSHVSSKGSKVAKSIPITKTPDTQKVYFRGVDVTPMPLTPAPKQTKVGIVTPIPDKDKDKERIRPVVPLEGEVPSLQSGIGVGGQSISRFHTELRNQAIEAGSSYLVTTVTYATTEDYLMKDISIPEEVSVSSAGPLSEEADYEMLSAIVHGTYKVPSRIKITLVETPTDYIFELPSKTVERDTHEGALVDKDNRLYDYLTIGKGRNRKMVTEETQTMEIIQKRRGLHSFHYEENGKKYSVTKKKHSYAFVSNYELYDTYKEVAEREEHEALERSATVQVALKSMVTEEEHAQDNNLTENEKQMIKLIKNERFLEAVCVMERLLANNNFNEEQKRYRGLVKPDPFRKDIEYNYRLKHLWTYANKNTEGKCVSAAVFNKKTDDILAVGYGKFYFTDVSKGMVYIWNIKNPVQPERTYNFEEPVTALSFSRNNPNILAIGFYNGKIILINTASRSLCILGESDEDSPSHLPVWQLRWFQSDDYKDDSEQLAGSFHDGRVCIFKNIGSVTWKCTQIMRMTRAEGKLKGLETVKQCRAQKLSCSQYISVNVIRRHPQNKHHYCVGTSEGTVHTCSKHYFQHYLDVFRAHDGGISQMKTSPFCDKIFLTSGDDWYCRIWADGIIEPLIELIKEMQTCEDAAWSPTHSTIIANLSGADIYIWDLQRKAYYPQSIHQTPTNVRNTVVMFTSNGQCLLVGDIEGNVHVFSLEDMPIPAFFNDILLKHSLQKALATQQLTLKRLEKLGNLNFDESKTGKYFS